MLKDNYYKKNTGNSGEQKASEYLLSLGYEIVCRNYREKSGEIDIIVQKEDKIVFVEVKTLPNGYPELLGHLLDNRKQKKIVKTAKSFLLKHRQYSNNLVCFDVIVIDMPDYGPLYHIENAFSELL